MIMQRLHLDDPVGHVLDQEEWTVLNLPAIAERDERYEIDTIWGRRQFIRKEGAALHPAREPVDVLMKLKK
ncbi:hypothetical protein ACFS07_10800 [Undibacterium arcticum]